ncbi:MAG: peptide ABC transporter ATP-binding protein [Rhizobiales bacterium]|nr:peptide ABC transporter ATP-binding protein [Hyphomicrobiales bacterium]MBA68424.1 peptide ABC transporter ATP-binding protein [Hyphomicrobiales bacterium]|tara:strand:- start:431 stop:1402 length:972 start_codon:yes stop_codon:yes gene_type:complete
MNAILDIKGLRACLRGRSENAYVIDGLDLTVQEGEVVALVGESGSGKSMTAFSILQLLPPAIHITDGTILLGGHDVMKMDVRTLRQVRGTQASIVFQEPMTSLNPLMTVERQIAEMLLIHGKATRRTAPGKVIELLELVRMPDAKRRAKQYPHNLSGGLRQRAMIALALACEPRLLIADEPTTALDVTIQQQILKLLLDLRDRLGMAILLITHDLGVVAEMADRVAVMYAGRIVEHGPVVELLEAPRHPYTHGLLSCLPAEHADPDERLTEIPGLPPQPGSIRQGCPFAPRCPRSDAICTEVEPAMTSDGASHYKCHHPWTAP